MWSTMYARIHDLDKIKPGDWIQTIYQPGGFIVKEIISQDNYGMEAKPDRYVEFVAENDNKTYYWKERQDGGQVLRRLPDVDVTLTWGMDGNLVIQIDTPEDLVDEAGSPLCRVYLNDGDLFLNPDLE